MAQYKAKQFRFFWHEHAMCRRILPSSRSAKLWTVRTRRRGRTPDQSWLTKPFWTIQPFTTISKTKRSLLSLTLPSRCVNWSTRGTILSKECDHVYSLQQCCHRQSTCSDLLMLPHPLEQAILQRYSKQNVYIYIYTHIYTASKRYIKIAVSIWLFATAVFGCLANIFTRRWSWWTRLEACTLLKRHYVSLGSCGLLTRECGKVIRGCGRWNWWMLCNNFSRVFACFHFGHEELFVGLCE